jgi:MYXO-CTERM domain-containing protein
MKRNFLSLGGATLLSGLALSGMARADIPAGYTGTPFKGTPVPIPGRVNLIDFDNGGQGVAFQVVHQGDVACAGYDYRPAPRPTLCKTSATEGDHYTVGPLTGTTFPSATTSDYYVGAIRPGDWVQVTVDVKQAGTYSLSSTWASAAPIDMKVSFNGVLKNEKTLPNTGDYHNWIPYPNYATVQLDAGVQVLRFQSVNEHVNMDYIVFDLVGADGGVIPSPDSGSSGTGGASGAGGAAGAGGSTAIGAGGSTAIGAGGSTVIGAGGSTAIGTGGAAGSGTGGSTVGAGGSTAVGAGGSTLVGAGGAAGSGTGGSAGTAGTSTPSAPAATAADPAGCSCSLENRSASRQALLGVGLLFAGLAIRRQRRRS